jgi:hypothetical protein
MESEPEHMIETHETDREEMPVIPDHPTSEEHPAHDSQPAHHEHEEAPVEHRPDNIAVETDDHNLHEMLAPHHETQETDHFLTPDFAQLRSEEDAAHEHHQDTSDHILNDNAPDHLEPEAWAAAQHLPEPIIHSHHDDSMETAVADSISHLDPADHYEEQHEAHHVLPENDEFDIEDHNAPIHHQPEYHHDSYASKPFHQPVQTHLSTYLVYWIVAVVVVVVLLIAYVAYISGWFDKKPLPDYGRQ